MVMGGIKIDTQKRSCTGLAAYTGTVQDNNDDGDNVKTNKQYNCWCSALLNKVKYTFLIMLKSFKHVAPSYL